MKQIMTVFQFTFRDAIKRKAFIISSIIIFAVILIASLIPRGVDFFTGGDGQETGTEATYYYVDDQDILPTGETVLKEAFPQAKIVKISGKQIEKYKKDIRDNHKDNSIIIMSEEDGQAGIKVITYNFMGGANTGVVGDVLNKAYAGKVLGDAGVSPEVIAGAMMDLPMETEAASDMTVTSYVISILLTFLIFFSIYYYGYAVAMSVATEKASRVMETLVVSAKPSRILIGKIFAMGALGLMQLAMMLAFGVLCYKIFIPKGFALGGMSLDVSGFNGKTVALLLIYFILGYALYAVMNSVSGALVSKIEDLSAAMAPILVIALGSFYMGYIAIAMGGKNTLGTVATYVPFSSPFIIPSRVLNGDMTMTELALSMAILVVTIVVITLLSVRVYSVSVLRYGKRQSMIRALIEKK
ncbi:MAG: ABC transporter permease [Anaerovoracaceae bacterium]|jgi:ABC-2 type transport system permease protein